MHDVCSSSGEAILFSFQNGFVVFESDLHVFWASTVLHLTAAAFSLDACRRGDCDADLHPPREMERRVNDWEVWRQSKRTAPRDERVFCHQGVPGRRGETEPAAKAPT